jgi:hypothetical protein
MPATDQHQCNFCEGKKCTILGDGCKNCEYLCDGIFGRESRCLNCKWGVLTTATFCSDQAINLAREALNMLYTKYMRAEISENFLLDMVTITKSAMTHVCESRRIPETIDLCNHARASALDLLGCGLNNHAYIIDNNIKNINDIVTAFYFTIPAALGIPTGVPKKKISDAPSSIQ